MGNKIIHAKKSVSPVLALVVPCYNESEALPGTIDVLGRLLDGLVQEGLVDAASGVLLVDDGSCDGTWNMIERAHAADARFHGLKLAHNRGHQTALFAGLVFVADKCDVSISLDADLQDDVSVIPEMLRKHEAGAEIVYGVRSDRTTDSWFKKTSAESFYSALGALGVESVPNCADFRLMGSSSLASLAEYGETNLFLRGIVASMGYRSDKVFYKRLARQRGKTKYSLGKMAGLAIDGVTSFSVAPLRVIAVLGACVFAVAVAVGIWILAEHFSGNTVPGWSTLALSIWAFGGLQLFALGVVGEYVGKTYMEAKGRPRFIVEKHI